MEIHKILSNENLYSRKQISYIVFDHCSDKKKIKLTQLIQQNFTLKGIKWSVWDFVRPQDHCLKMRDWD